MTTSLVHVLHSVCARGRDESVRVTVDPCAHILWNAVTVRRLYGGTRVRVRRADGRVHNLALKRIPPAWFTVQAPWRQRIVRMRVRAVRRSETAADEVRGELLRSLATTQHGGKDLLRALTFQDLEVVWQRVPTLA